MLDDFSAAKIDASNGPRPPPPSASGASVPKAKASQTADTEAQKSPYEDMDGEELTKAMQAGVDGMIGELEKSVSRPPRIPGPRQSLTRPSSTAGVAGGV